jgi:hypothetical protein
MIIMIITIFMMIIMTIIIPPAFDVFIQILIMDGDITIHTIPICTGMIITPQAGA